MPARYDGPPHTQSAGCRRCRGIAVCVGSVGMPGFWGNEHPLLLDVSPYSTQERGFKMTARKSNKGSAERTRGANLEPVGARRQLQFSDRGHPVIGIGPGASNHTTRKTAPATVAS